MKQIERLRLEDEIDHAYKEIIKIRESKTLDCKSSRIEHMYNFIRSIEEKLGGVRLVVTDITEEE